MHLWKCDAQPEESSRRHTRGGLRHVGPCAPVGTGNRRPHRHQDAALGHGFEMLLDSGLCSNIMLASGHRFKDSFLYVCIRWSQTEFSIIQQFGMTTVTAAFEKI